MRALVRSVSESVPACAVFARRTGSDIRSRASLAARFPIDRARLSDAGSAGGGGAETGGGAGSAERAFRLAELSTSGK